MKRALIPYSHSSPFVFNLDAILVLFGALVWGICVIMAQMTGGIVISEVSRIGEVCFYMGIGRASKTNGSTKSGPK